MRSTTAASLLAFLTMMDVEICVLHLHASFAVVPGKEMVVGSRFTLEMFSVNSGPLRTRFLETNGIVNALSSWTRVSAIVVKILSILSITTWEAIGEFGSDGSKLL